MRYLHALIFVLALVVFPGRSAQGQAATWVDARESLLARAYGFAYPGGMLFHTAFMGTVTTRYLLLKSALRAQTIADYLSIDATQRAHIAELRPVRSDVTSPPKLNERRLNDQLDEDLVDADYFAFLRPDQLVLLDRLAFRFDGFAALSRRSLARHLELSNRSTGEIAKAIDDIRDEVILLGSRMNFAAQLPVDFKYRDVLFKGAICTRLNQQIIDLLTEQECERVRAFLADFDRDAIDAVERMAPLPPGLLHLAQENDMKVGRESLLRMGTR